MSDEDDLQDITSFIANMDLDVDLHVDSTEEELDQEWGEGPLPYTGSETAQRTVSYITTMSTEDRRTVGEFMFADIVLVVDDQEVTPNISALQDTGALQHSYVRQDVLDDHPDLFKLIKKANIENTKQADGISTLEISYIIVVDAIIKHHDGTPMTIKGLRLLVAKKLSQRLILGAPDMVRLAPTVFMSFFMATVTANHSLT
jgi:hypothetical protein